MTVPAVALQAVTLLALNCCVPPSATVALAGATAGAGVVPPPEPPLPPALLPDVVTGTVIWLLPSVPGFRTKNVAEAAGAWYPVACTAFDVTERVTSCTAPSITTAPCWKPWPVMVTVKVPEGSGFGLTEPIVGPGPIRYT